jgi:hypothetical protein
LKENNSFEKYLLTRENNLNEGINAATIIIDKLTVLSQTPKLFNDVLQAAIPCKQA